ncbi:MAG TPA: hypothetical protein VFD70_09630 [Anaerolineae bacterium]|nr:hypothetical protein [Anaerolineae bacterium]
MTAFAVTLVLVFCGAFPRTVSAHPLGNFTINHYTRLEIAPTQIQLYVVFDYAEIPTFQEKQTMDRNGDGTISVDERADYLNAALGKITSNLTLEVDGKPALLSPIPNSAQLEFLPGQGGLEIMQIRARFTAPLQIDGSPVSIQYRDDNYRERLGWREIVAKPSADVMLVQSNVRDTETSDELRNYPQDLLSNPLNDRAAALTVSRGASELSKAPNAAALNQNSFILIALIVALVAVLLVSGLLILRRKPNAR